jgi:hypothetical protein
LQKADPVPAVPEAVDAVFLQGEHVSELLGTSGLAALPVEDTSPDSRQRLNTLLLGLAASVALLQHGRPARPEGRDRRLPRVQVSV